MGFDTLPIHFLAFSICHRLSRGEEFRKSGLLFGNVSLRRFIDPPYQVPCFLLVP